MFDFFYTFYWMATHDGSDFAKTKMLSLRNGLNQVFSQLSDKGKNIKNRL
jgi:hypothetical protein